MKAYRQLKVWQAAMDLAQMVFRMTAQFPNDQKFTLTSQMQRAALSIPSNIAEGYGRIHRGDYVHHLSMARGSLMELETQIILAVRLNYLPRNIATAPWMTAQNVGRMLTQLIDRLKPPPKQPKTRSNHLDPRP